jgi:hypothetical protein
MKLPISGKRSWPSLWRRALSYPFNVAIGVALGGIVVFAIDFLDLTRHGKITGVLGTALILTAFGYIFMVTIGGLIGGFISLCRLRLFAVLCYLVAPCSVILATHGSAWLKDDRFAFPGRSHKEIADLYKRHGTMADLSQPGITDKFPGLIEIDDTCHPPSGCECWIAYGPARSLGIEHDIGGWHRPISSVFPDTSPSHFAIVTVQKIQGDAYSVMGCSMDWRSFWLR